MFGILCKGWNMNNYFTYKSIGNRNDFSAENNILIGYILRSTRGIAHTSIFGIINLSLSLTSKQLVFS